MDRKSSSLGDLSTNFWIWEFRCPCKKCRRKRVKVSDFLLFKLEMLRMKLEDKPINITSGNRCVPYNESIHGHPTSAHIPYYMLVDKKKVLMGGEAADIKVKGLSPINIGLVAEEVKGFRIGIGSNFVHLDVRKPSPSKFWIYLGGRKIIYSVDIENESLSKFYKVVTGGE